MEESIFETGKTCVDPFFIETKRSYGGGATKYFKGGFENLARGL